MDIRESMIKALRKRYEAVIEEAKATAEVYLLRPVGIGAVSYTHLTLPTKA